MQVGKGGDLGQLVRAAWRASGRQVVVVLSIRVRIEQRRDEGLHKVVIAALHYCRHLKKSEEGQKRQTACTERTEFCQRSVLGSSTQRPKPAGGLDLYAMANASRCKTAAELLRRHSLPNGTDK